MNKINNLKANDGIKNRTSNLSEKSIKELYSSNEYLNAYTEHTNRRVQHCPKSAVGGLWEEIGTLQFEFLVQSGLKPDHSLLDIGCGTLRGGRNFINYLLKANYTGIDISIRAIESAKELIHSECLEPKKPTLILNKHKNLQFKMIQSMKFDYLLAQSVFTHLQAHHIEECFAYIGRIMHEKSMFYFTYNLADDIKQVGLKDFKYPLSFFKCLAKKHGFNFQNLSQTYPHPRQQQMAVISKHIE